MPEVRSLVDGSYWQGVNAASAGQDERQATGILSRLRSAVGRLGERGVFRNYSDYLVWDVLLRKFLPSGTGLKALEIGSAPGGHLVRLHDTFGFDVFGIEYTESGVEVNRRRFLEAGIDPARVLALDFMSDSAMAVCRGQFDVVTSFGFVEHFDDPKAVIARHVDAVRPGGLLVVLVPNLHGPLGMMAEWLHPGILAIHNTAIMTRDAYASVFDDPRIEQVHCGPIGTVNLGVLNADGATLHRATLACANLAQLAFSPLLRLFFGSRGLETESLSPYFAFVGRRVSVR